MKKYKVASILMIIHGFMELGGCLFLIFALFAKSNELDVSQFFSFIVPFFQENLILMALMGAIYGVVRVIGAIGLWKNRKWGLVLSVINCIVTMILMMFMLPAGVMDGILVCSALILILMEYFGDEKIID